MDIPSDRRYTQEHEWVLVEGSNAKIGITDFAQDALGDVVFVDAPAIDETVGLNDSFGEVESTKSVSEIYAPVAGTVVAVNEALDDQPELLNTDPYGAGWICTIAISDSGQLDSLLDADAYRALTES